MLAVLLKAFTDSPGSLRATEVPEPALQPGEVLVRIEAAGINPSDLLNIKGGFDHTELPRIVGRDFAGRVVDGPPHLLERDVWGSGGGELGYTRDGTHAEFLALPEDAVALRPQPLDAEHAAAAGVPYVTAWHALVERSGLTRNRWVIVSGAAGAVGTAALQIVRYAGSRSVALLKDESELERLDRVKPDAVAFSTKNDLESVVKKATGGAGAEIALNTVGSPIFPVLMAALSLGGRMAIISGVAGREVNLDLMNLYRRDISLVGVNSANLTAAQSARVLTEMHAAFETGQIRPPGIGPRFPLSRANEAYEAAAAPNSKVVLVTK